MVPVEHSGRTLRNTNLRYADRTMAGDIRNELKNAGPRPAAEADRTGKKNYAERLPRQLAQKVADELREDFPGVTPNADGRGHESPARTAKGFKKLDVNYSTLELGLGLGVSIKTINFPIKEQSDTPRNTLAPTTS